MNKILLDLQQYYEKLLVDVSGPLVYHHHYHLPLILLLL
jgi:hypothetical protein